MSGGFGGSEGDDLIKFFFFFSFRVFENGKETVMSYENDVLKSKTVNGINQAISYKH